jgi:hypothetical protein
VVRPFVAAYDPSEVRPPQSVPGPSQGQGRRAAGGSGRSPQWSGRQDQGRRATGAPRLGSPGGRPVMPRPQAAAVGPHTSIVRRWSAY